MKTIMITGTIAVKIAMIVNGSGGPGDEDTLYECY